MKRPWSKKEFPVLAGWLAANEKPLALLVAASKRPRRYDPLISEDGSVLAISLAGRAAVPGSGAGLDRTGDAPRGRRQGGRGVGGPAGLPPPGEAGRPGTDVDRGIGRHCRGRGWPVPATRDCCSARLTPAQIARMRADLDKLPPLPKMVDKINLAERFMYLDCVGMVARRGIASISVAVVRRQQTRGYVSSR